MEGKNVREVEGEKKKPKKMHKYEKNEKNKKGNKNNATIGWRTLCRGRFM